MNGASNGVSIKVTNGTSTNGYVKTGDFRAYKGYTIVLTASDNSAITKITSEKGGKTFTNGVKADQGTLVIKNNAINWTGSSNVVKLTISGTVSFKDIVVTCENGKTLTSLSISGEPTKKVYNAGEALDPTGLVVTGTYDDATTAKISSGITWTMNPETLSADNTTCTVTATVGGVTSGSYEVTGLTVKPKEVVGENRWVKTTLSDLLPTDQVVIVDVTSQRAMSNDKGTSDAPTVVSVTLDGDALTGTVAENCVWNVTKNSDNTYTFFPNGTTEKWLYTTRDNNGVRVGTSDNKYFVEHADGSYNGLENTATTRYVGVYNSKDWRCYTSTSTNIKSTSIAYYKYASNKTATKIVFEKGDATFDQGAENPLYENAAMVNTADGTVVEGATVTYTSSDAEYAVVDEKGAVLVDATVPGTYTITASFAGDDTYASAKASYTITVNKVLQLTGEGTLDKPYTVADVIAIVNDGAQTKNPVYVKGIVSKVVSSANNIEQYKNCDSSFGFRL